MISTTLINTRLISTRLYERIHRLRCQGQMNETLLLNAHELEQLQTELGQMQCRRALQALNQPEPSFGGFKVVVKAVEQPHHAKVSCLRSWRENCRFTEPQPMPSVAAGFGIDEQADVA